MYMSHNAYGDFMRSNVTQPMYNNPQQNFSQFPPQSQQQYLQPTFQLAKVNGRSGAEDYARQLPPNVQTSAFDEKEMLAYIITTYNGGQPTIITYDLTQHIEETTQPQQISDYVTRNEFETFKQELISSIPTTQPKTQVKTTPTKPTAKPKTEE